MHKINPKVEEFINKTKKWQEEMKKLRAIVLDCGLKEEYKWMHPCYTWQNKNIVLLHGFKDYCAILFYKGALIKDEKNLLIQQTENVQSGRQIRFTDIIEIEKLELVIKEYIYKAIKVEKTGLKIKLKETSQFIVTEELKQKFEEDPLFKSAFENLTPGRQRGYLLHFSQPKQSNTRLSRIEKNAKRIFDGKGLTDCICGHSKRIPNCDGSHKNI